MLGSRALCQIYVATSYRLAWLQTLPAVIFTIKPPFLLPLRRKSLVLSMEACYLTGQRRTGAYYEVLVSEILERDLSSFLVFNSVSSGLNRRACSDRMLSFIKLSHRC